MLPPATICSARLHPRRTTPLQPRHRVARRHGEPGWVLGITSLPLPLCAVGRVIKSGRQVTLRLTSTHAEAARAQVGTIRLKLLKIGAVVCRNTRRAGLLLSSTYPYLPLAL